MSERKLERVEPMRKSPGKETRFLPVEVVDRVEHMFFIQELDGPVVEKNLDIRRPLFERAAKAAYRRLRNPNGPNSVRATGPSLVRRIA